MVIFTSLLTAKSIEKSKAHPDRKDSSSSQNERLFQNEATFEEKKKHVEMPSQNNSHLNMDRRDRQGKTILKGSKKHHIAFRDEIPIVSEERENQRQR